MDQLCRRQMVERKHEAIEVDASGRLTSTAPELETALDEDLGEEARSDSSAPRSWAQNTRELLIARARACR